MSYDNRSFLMQFLPQQEKRPSMIEQVAKPMTPVDRLRFGGQGDIADEVEKALSDAYAMGRKDEREEWRKRIVPLLRELEASEYLSEQQCAGLLDVGLVSWRTLRHEQEECPDCEGKGVAGEILPSGDPFQPPEVQGCPTCGKTR